MSFDLDKWQRQLKRPRLGYYLILAAGFLEQDALQAQVFHQALEFSQAALDPFRDAPQVVHATLRSRAHHPVQFCDKGFLYCAVAPTPRPAPARVDNTGFVAVHLLHGQAHELHHVKGVLLQDVVSQTGLGASLAQTDQRLQLAGGDGDRVARAATIERVPVEAE